MLLNFLWALTGINIRTSTNNLFKVILALPVILLKILPSLYPLSNSQATSTFLGICHSSPPLPGTEKSLLCLLPAYWLEYANRRFKIHLLQGLWLFQGREFTCARGLILGVLPELLIPPLQRRVFLGVIISSKIIPEDILLQDRNTCFFWLTENNLDNTKITVSPNSKRVSGINYISQEQKLLPKEIIYWNKLTLNKRLWFI